MFSLLDGLCLSTLQIPLSAGLSASSFRWSGLTIIKTNSVSSPDGITLDFRRSDRLYVFP